MILYHLGDVCLEVSSTIERKWSASKTIGDLRDSDSWGENPPDDNIPQTMPANDWFSAVRHGFGQFLFDFFPEPWRFSNMLGGGFKYFVFSSLPGEMIQFDYYFSDGLKPPTSMLFHIQTFKKTLKQSLNLPKNINDKCMANCMQTVDLLCVFLWQGLYCTVAPVGLDQRGQASFLPGFLAWFVCMGKNGLWNCVNTVCP